MSRFLDNDWLFMFLFIFGSAVGVVYLFVLIIDLLTWPFRRFRRKPQTQVSQRSALPPPVVHLGATFDQLDAVINDLAGRLVR